MHYKVLFTEGHWKSRGNKSSSFPLPNSTVHSWECTVPICWTIIFWDYFFVQLCEQTRIKVKKCKHFLHSTLRCSFLSWPHLMVMNFNNLFWGDLTSILIFFFLLLETHLRSGEGKKKVWKNMKKTLLYASLLFWKKAEWQSNLYTCNED